jgi:hypothetical protein
VATSFVNYLDVELLVPEFFVFSLPIAFFNAREAFTLESPVISGIILGNHCNFACEAILAESERSTATASSTADDDKVGQILVVPFASFWHT